ncbi:MAG: DUF362 domain-containing protein [Bacteroidales bacterium]|nr:DUF362 domain-containing protein [Bacteroidales bacterium]
MNKIATLKKRITWISITAIAFAAICWDMSTSESTAIEEGTFRFESAFEAVDYPNTKVAVVPSDYSDLTTQVSRSVDPGYAQIELMVRKAVELQGGLDGVVAKGNKVMLKVNLVGGNSPSGQGENTDVRVVKALIKILHEHTEGDITIIIGEGTARSNDDINSVTSVWANSGYRDLLTDPYLSGINFSLFNLNQTYSDLVEVDLGSKGTGAPHGYKYHIHKLHNEIDVFISVPVLKIHNTGMTAALKNQIGIAPAAYYGYNKMKGTSYYPSGLVHDVGHRRWTTEEIVDLSTIADINFVVVDAVMCLQSSKTYSPENQVRFNTVLAGKDPVAVDNVCTRLFCMNPDDIAHITLSEKVGLGTNDPEKIEVVGATIDQVKKKVKHNTENEGLFGQGNRTWLVSGTFNSTDMSAEQIANEATLEPVAGENGFSQPVYFFDDRIDLLSYYSGASNVISYAFTYFYAPKDQQAEFWVGSDDDMIIYLNGQKVYTYSGTRTYSDGMLLSEKKTISIKQGENSLLVKTLNKSGDYSFALNICEVETVEVYSGNRVDGLKFYTTKQTTNPTDLIENYANTKLTLDNYPNPVINEATLKFELPVASRTSLDIYDLNGRHLYNIVNKEFAAGEHLVRWSVDQSGKRLPEGLYICKITAGKYAGSIKITVSK